MENKDISLIAALRVWRNADHEDFLTLSRHEVIKLLEEIDSTKDVRDVYRNLSVLPKT